MLRARGNAAEVPGTYVPWLPFGVNTSPGEQSIRAQNRLGGSAEARGGASGRIGASSSAALDGSWGSSDPAEGSRRVDGTTRYLLDGLSVVAQYAPDGHRQAWYTQSLARIDEVLNVANDSGKFWYQADALGSVYGLTNQAGALVGSQNYDVFGAPTPAPSGPAGQPFGFTGREHELDSGLVYARDRYMQAAFGRWTQADRLGFTAGPNFYDYVGGQPTRFTDPSGQNWNPTQIAHASFSAGIAVGVSAVLAAAVSLLGPALLDTIGIEVFALVGGATSLAVGVVWELYTQGAKDRAEDLIADALGAAAGAFAFLAITGLLAPRNLMWASLIASVYVPLAVGIAFGGYAVANICQRYR